MTSSSGTSCGLALDDGIRPSVKALIGFDFTSRGRPCRQLRRGAPASPSTHLHREPEARPSRLQGQRCRSLLRLIAAVRSLPHSAYDDAKAEMPSRRSRHRLDDASFRSSGAVTAPTLTYRVPSPAMAPTLRVGEYVTVSLDAYYAPRVGDVVVFHPPTGADPATPICGNPQQGAGHSAACSTPTSQKSSGRFIKRIVAGPGDTLQISNGG